MDQIEIVESMMIPIDTARKDVNWVDGTPYDANDEDHVSEWAMATVFARFKPGDMVDQDYMKELIYHAKIQQMLDSMVERGFMNAIWDPKQEAVVYNLTQLGEALGAEIAKRQGL